MPANQKRATRSRHTPPGTPEDLWRRGRYVEAMARNPLIRIFILDAPVLTFEQVFRRGCVAAKSGLGQRTSVGADPRRAPPLAFP